MQKGGLSQIHVSFEGGYEEPLKNRTSSGRMSTRQQWERTSEILEMVLPAVMAEQSGRMIIMTADGHGPPRFRGMGLSEEWVRFFLVSLKTAVIVRCKMGCFRGRCYSCKRLGSSTN